MLKANQDQTKQKDFEANHNMIGFVELLIKVHKRNNPEYYENLRNTNNTDQGE